MYKDFNDADIFPDTISDEELCRKAAEGSRRAEEILVTRYHRLVRACARPYFLAGGDSEDLIQEGMVGLIYAVREYDAEKNASFRTFAEVCIRNKLISVLRAANCDKHTPLNQSIPLDIPFFEHDSNSQIASELVTSSPEEQVINREYAEHILSGVRRQLSEFEAKILGYYLDGYSCQEIAEFVGRSLKSVDNAVQRVRRKVSAQ